MGSSWIEVSGFSRQIWWAAHAACIPHFCNFDTFIKRTWLRYALRLELKITKLDHLRETWMLYSSEKKQLVSSIARASVMLYSAALHCIRVLP